MWSGWIIMPFLIIRELNSLLFCGIKLRSALVLQHRWRDGSSLAGAVNSQQSNQPHKPAKKFGNDSKPSSRCHVECVSGGWPTSPSTGSAKAEVNFINAALRYPFLVFFFLDICSCLLIECMIRYLFWFSVYGINTCPINKTKTFSQPLPLISV